MLGLHWASLGAWLVETPPVMQETGLDAGLGRCPGGKAAPARSSLLQAGAPAAAARRCSGAGSHGAAALAAGADPARRLPVQQQALRRGLSSRPRRVGSS